MGYNMKRGNSAVPFKELGSSPARFDIESKETKQKPSKFYKMGTVGARPQAEGSGDIDWKSEKPENKPDWSFTNE